MAPNQVYLDPSQNDSGWAVFYNGKVVASGFNSKGAALAQLALYEKGYRKVKC